MGKIFGWCVVGSVALGMLSIPFQSPGLFVVAVYLGSLFLILRVGYALFRWLTQ